MSLALPPGEGILEGLSEPAALIDRTGRILACNALWQASLPRRNLLSTLEGSPSRAPFLEALRAVLDGSSPSATSELLWSPNSWIKGKVRRLPQTDSLAVALVALEPLAYGGFQRLLDQLHDPVFVMNASTGETTYCNSATLRHLELDAGERPTVSHYGALFQPDELPRLADRLQGGLPLVVESVMRTSTGRRLAVELSLHLQGADIVGVVRSTSRRKQDLQAILSAGVRLGAILESAPVAIVSLTLEGFVASWNRAAESIYGWTAAEVLLQVTPFQSAPEMAELIAQVRRERSTGRIVLDRRGKDGETIRLSLSLCPLLNEHGEVHGLLEVAEDITDRSAFELLESNRRLVEAREAERARLARDVHDGPLQDLLAIGFALADLEYQLEDAQAEARFALLARRERSRSLVVARTLRALIRELRPAGLEQLGLVTPLQYLVDKMVQDATNPPEVQLDLEEVGELSDLQRLCIYRCAQESLYNCFRHAGARSVRVQLRRLEGQAELSISDDGCGFEASKTLSDLASREHYGVSGMAERADLSGAVLTIVSAPGAGTQIRLTCSLAASGQDPPDEGRYTAT